MVKIDDLPTHLARVGSRLNAIGLEASADTFLVASYFIESFIKTISAILCSAIKKTTPNIAYQFEYDLVRGDGLGIWDSSIGKLVGNAYVGYLSQDIQSLVEWITKKRTKAEDAWAREVFDNCAQIIALLGISDQSHQKAVSIKHVLSQLVLIRNKTKAHGAAGPDFFSKANPLFTSAVARLISDCPINKWEWFYLGRRSITATIIISLKGLEVTNHPQIEGLNIFDGISGVYFRTHLCGSFYCCNPLIITTEECVHFWMPNGGFMQSGNSEYIDYTDHVLKTLDSSSYLRPPAPLPSSKTEGQTVLDIYSNVFGNLPTHPPDYVERKKLQDEILDKIRDKNHTILTLHGQGGKGKTYLALFAAYKISSDVSSPFEYIIWLSARDLELKPDGPSEVRRGVASLIDVCKVIGELFNIGKIESDFAELLRNPKCAGNSGNNGILFIFDNFETFDDPVGLHQFLDTHTHIPNKVVITSRKRAFKGDYPIEVGGMEFDEARELISNQSRILGIEGLISEEQIEKIYEFTDGHAYVIRVLLGEIEKEKKWIPLKSLITKRSDMLNAIFERSFNRLSDSGRFVFLTIGNWRSILTELSIYSILGLREIDVEAGIEECIRLSLINSHELNDGQFGYSTPELAHIFAKKKLDGDADKYQILEDLKLLEKFGPIKIGEATLKKSDDNYFAFFKHAKEIGQAGSQLVQERIEKVMKRVAESWPKGWLFYSEYLQDKDKLQNEEIRYSLRRAVEEMPYSKKAWLARANYAKSEGDRDTFVFSMISAAESDPNDVELINEAAFRVNQYINEYKEKIPLAKRGVYLASIRMIMEKNVGKLDANGLSKLAWLYLHEGNENEAIKYAKKGLEKDPSNDYCLTIIRKLL